MIFQTSTFGLVALLAAGSAAFPSASPYQDGSCQNPVDSWSYKTKNGTVKNGPFETGFGTSANYSVTGQYNFETYNDVAFDLPSTNTQQGQKVFWKMNNLDKGCRVLFMKPFLQAGQSSVPGSVILSAGDSEYCYYADITSKMHLAFCCGTGDCTPFDVGMTELNPIDPKKNANNGPSASAAQALGQSPKAQTPKKRHQPPSHGSLAARAAAEARYSIQARTALTARDPPKQCNSGDKACLDREWAKCTSKVIGDPISKPGKQDRVGDWVTCSLTEACSIEQSRSTTYSYEVSVSTTDTEGSSSTEEQSSAQTNTNSVEVTNTDGYSLSVGASVGFGPFGVSSDASTDHSHTTDTTNTNTNVQEQSSSTSFSQTVANTTGHAITNAKGETISEKLFVQPGSHAVLTFTSFYKCYPIEVDCGAGNPWTWSVGDHNVSYPTLKTEICEPDTTNGDVNGEFNLLYSNPSSGD